MQEVINCPSCRRKLQVPESLLGQDVQCPTCGATFIANWDSPAPPPPPRPAPAGPPPYQPPPYRPPTGPARHESPEADDYDSYDDRPDDDNRMRRYPRRRDMMPDRGGAILTMGVLSLLVPGVGLILGIMAWVMGEQDMKEIRAGRMDRQGESSTSTGRVCGIISTILHAAGLGLCCLWYVVLVSTVPHYGRF